jgi:hypothetical protein
MTRCVVVVAMILCAVPTSTLNAQWPSHEAPGTPHQANGKPDMFAPGPRSVEGRPDLSGIWVSQCGIAFGDECFVRSLFFDLAKDLKQEEVVMTPWASVIAQQRETRNHVDDPYGYCLPPGTPRINFGGAPFRIVQTSQVTVFLYETTANMTFRQVYTDGRTLPAAAEPTWLGYSVGRWEADTFVVETTGFRDGGWLDTRKGRPHSDALRVIERFRRVDYGHLELKITIIDPKAYVKPWTITAPLELMPDTSLLESFCDNHTSTMEHRRIDPAPTEPPSPRVP